MIIEKDYYKRNIKTGDIVKRQKVWVKCDQCGEEWETLYEYVKYKKLKDNLCVSCRCKNNAGGGKKYKKKKKINCDFCGREFSRSVNIIKKKNFCSRSCSGNNYLRNKYGHLEKIFDNNPDEVAYLFGIILGDGHLKKQEQKNTTRVSVAFDVNLRNLLDISLLVIEKLEIGYYVEPGIRSNCQMVGFILPDDLLKKYGMDFVGDKYKAQPSIYKKVSRNINFVAGMINSDGSCVLNNNGYKDYERIMICGVTKSIMDSCCYCLDRNNIDYKFYSYKGRTDKRNGNLNKDSYQLQILKQGQIEKLRKIIIFDVKEPSNGRNAIS